MGLVVAVCAALVLPAVASAAAFPPLTEQRARPLAVKLARQVAVKRKARSWNVSDAVSVRRNRVVFVYSDRNAQERFCTANLVVEQSSTLRHAFLASRTCFTIPTEALEMERATSALIRAVQGQRTDVRRSVRGYEKDLDRCEGVVVPRGRHDAVELLYSAGEVLAAFDPLLVHLDGFVTRLQEIQPEDNELVSGVVWWRRFVTAVDGLPDVVARPCSAMLKWSETNYSDDTAPVDFPALLSTLNAIERQERGIARAGLHLEELGISPRITPGFVPEGLLVFALG